MTGDHTRREFLVLAGGTVAAAHPHRNARPHHHRRHKRHRKRRHPIEQIEHVVILTQENCSFDHYFGTLRGVRGFGDPTAIKLPGGRPVFEQPLPGIAAGYVLPWRLDISRANPCVTTNGNDWKEVHQAVNGGRMDGFVAHGSTNAAPGFDAMRYFARPDIPWHMALADAFTVCDAYHASVLGPTNPNRLFIWTGTIDPRGRDGGPVIDNSEKPPYRWTTYPERLQHAGVTWRVYQQEDNFDDNALAWFQQYQQAKPGSPLYENGLRRRSADAFAQDVAAGRLPQVSWLIAPTDQSEHPFHAPGPGAAFVDAALQALFAHPSVWRKTVFVLNYDEPNCYFDHVRPPLPPAGTADEFVGGEPIGLGLRVPCVVCSPFSRGGYVCSRTYDHTSVIRLLERRFGVREPNISAWRRRTVDNLLTALDLERPDYSIPTLPATAPLVAASQYACAHHLPGTPPLLNQRMPTQEPGTRPRR